MPSGYTSYIYNGRNVSFQDFALICARAFGACFHQRGDPLTDKPKLTEPDIKYHLDAITEVIKKRTNPTKAEFEEFTKESILYHNSEIANKKALKRRYEAVLTEARNWTPPTSDHEKLKRFMIEQLEESLNYDCDTSYHYAEIEQLKNTTFEQYKNELKISMERDIKYHTEQIEKEKANVEKTNKWLTDLFNSLKK